MENEEFEKGRTFIENLEDVAGFLAMPYADIEGMHEYFGLQFLLHRPWLETQQHFGRYLALREQIPTNQDPDVLFFTQRIVDEMGVSPQFALLACMSPLPAKLAECSPVAYAAWQKTYYARAQTEYRRSIGDFVAFSSKAAVQAIFDLEHQKASTSALLVGTTQEPPNDHELMWARHSAICADEAARRFPSGKILLGGALAGVVVSFMLTPVIGSATFAVVFVLTHFKERSLIKEAHHANELRIEIERRFSRPT